MKNKLLTLFGILLFIQFSSKSQTIEPKDSLTVVKEKSDRNVMLNAESANAGPRNVNIGLPAATGGTIILENGLPVVVFSWPEMPFKTWRSDAMSNKVELFNIGQTAIKIGDVGFSVSTYDNLGTEKFQGSIALNSNHFGLINSTAYVSGPISKKGWKYAIGTFVNLDPGTYKAKQINISRYLADDTKLFKGAVTKDYSTSNGKGTFTLLYKFSDTKSIGRRQFAPYIYHTDGSVSEIDGFKIGSDNYIARKTIYVKDAKTGLLTERDLLKDYGTTSNTIDIIGKNELDNGLKLNYIIRLHSAKSGHLSYSMTGINNEGDVQNVMALSSRKTPIKSFSGLFETGKKVGKHEWMIGFNEWLYDVDKFLTEGMQYSQTVEHNPSLIEGSDRGYIFEYHDGYENNTAFFITDTWNINNSVTLNGGARLEYVALRGNYINNADIKSGEPYLNSPKTDIKKDAFRKIFMLDGIFRVNKYFGFLAEASYNEIYGHLENYSAGNNPNLKKSKVPVGGAGIYYNHPLVSLVSKATYITRNEYRSTITFTSPSQDVTRTPVSYDIETLGWTTDIVTNPIKNFSLHLLLTLQSPKYKNYSGIVNFNSGETIEYNFEDKIVSGISKILVEIDPSYQYNNLRIWASMRYFSKTYANLTNSLTFKERWETFAGANYKLNKSLDLNATIVNLLNQRGAQGTISGADLYTEEEAKQMEGKIMSGSYIRPFTIEFGLKYKF